MDGSTTRQRKLNHLLSLIDRYDSFKQTEFVYWLEHLPDAFVTNHGYEKVHPTEQQIKENELQIIEVLKEIKRVAYELDILYQDLETMLAAKKQENASY